MFFATPFTPSYWKTAAAEVKNLRMLAIAALFVGLRIVASAFFIPIGENLRIYFSFFINALGSLIYGPVFALMTGFTADILDFILHPTAAFFPGYVLSSMAGALFYALFFYRARITVLRVFLCKLSINLFVNVGLGALWSAILYGKGYYYYMAKSITKNILMLPIEVILLVMFFRVILPVVSKNGLALPQPSKKIPLI